MTATTAPRHPLLAAVTRTTIWLALLAGGHVALTAAGSRLPSPPGPWDLTALRQWIETTEVADAAFAILRLVALVGIWYLAAITVLTVLGSLSGLRPLTHLADVVAVPWARRLVRHIVGAGLTVALAGGIVPVAGGLAVAGASPVTAAAPAAQPAANPGFTVTMQALPDDGGVVVQALPGPERAASGHSLGHRIAPANAASPSGVTMRPLPGGAPTTWTAGPGDHLWHIAATHLEQQWHRTPTNSEVAVYWKTLVAENGDRLAVPGDPDLIHPGQVFVLPAVPPG